MSILYFRLRNQQDEEKKKRDDFDREGRHKLRELEREARYGGRDRGGYRDRDSDRDRDRGRDRGSAKERETEEKEKEAVRERYLGGVKKKKKVSHLLVQATHFFFLYERFLQSSFRCAS